MSAATPIQRTVEPTFTPVLSAAGGAPGAALAQLGEQGEDFAVQMERAAQEKDLVRARLDATKKLDDLSDRFRTDTDPDTMAARYSAEADMIGAGAGKDLGGNAATSFAADFETMSNSRLRNIKDLAFGRQVEQSTAHMDDTIETASRAAAYSANPAERASNVATIQKGIDGLVSTGIWSAEAGQRKMQTAQERLALYDGKSAVFLDPKTALKNLARRDYLPQLDPLERVQLQNSADAEMKQRAREARQRQSEARITAELAASDLHTVVSSGEHPAQALIDQAVHTAAASGDPRAMARISGLLHAVGFADSMRGASPRELDAGIASLEVRANKDGADVGMATALVASRKFKENMNSALAHDPLMWGQSQGVVNIAPLKLDGTDAPQAFQGRSAQAAQLSRRYGVPVPPLTQAEAETLKTRLDKDQDPDARLRTLQTVIGGFGPAAALPVLGKIGAGDPALANAGTLVSSGHAYVGTARDVLAGMSLLAGKTNDYLRPTAGGLAASKVNASLSAFALLPSSRTAVLAGAEAIYATQAARQGLVGADSVNTTRGRDLLARSFQLAAGARYEGDGTQWGGVSKYNDSPALVPGNIKADDFGDLVHQFGAADLAAGSVTGHPPVWEGNAAPDKLIRHTWLISGGNGVYGLSATDPGKGAMTPVLDSSHQPFRFRFNTALVAMQARTKRGQ